MVDARATSDDVHDVIIDYIPEDDGGWSAVVANLPGAGSCGDTREQAASHVVEALEGVLEAYEAEGSPVPWLVTLPPVEPGVIRLVTTHRRKRAA